MQASKEQLRVLGQRSQSRKTDRRKKGPRADRRKSLPTEGKALLDASFISAMTLEQLAAMFDRIAANKASPTYFKGTLSDAEKVTNMFKEHLERKYNSQQIKKEPVKIYRISGT